MIIIIIYIVIIIIICMIKRGLEYTGYRLRFSTEYLRDETVFHEYLQETCFVLTEISEIIRKPPGVYGRM